MARSPHNGAQIGFQPRIRKGAFFEAAWRHGCRSFSVYNRTYISGSFSDPESEYWSVVNDVALWPVMGERQIEITGPDAAQFVQLLTPRDMSKCAVGQCKYALITAADGGILSDPITLRPDATRFWLSTCDADLELWAKGVAVHAGMDVRIRDAGVSVLQVQGPKSAALLADMFGDAIRALKYYRLTTVDFAGTELLLSRTGWSGELGFELYLADASKGDALFEAVLEAGRPHDVRLGSVSQARRIESGILSWGIDMTPDETPYELGLDRLVELDNPADFIGKARLAALKDAPVTRRLVGLTVDGDRLAPNEDPWPLYRDGRPAGRITSLTFSPRLKKNIALGLVETACAAPGQSLTADTWTGMRDALVTTLPFVPKR